MRNFKEKLSESVVNLKVFFRSCVFKTTSN